MKKLLYGTLVLALVGIAFTFTSCEKSDIVTENTSFKFENNSQKKSRINNSNFSDLFYKLNPKEIGEKHNEFLALIHEGLKNKSSDLKEVTMKLEEKSLNDRQKYFIYVWAKQNNESVNHRLILSTLSSRESIEIYYQILNILEVFENSEGIKKEINYVLNNTKTTRLNRTDKQIINIFGETCIASARYWITEYDGKLEGKPSKWVTADGKAAAGASITWAVGAAIATGPVAPVTYFVSIGLGAALGSIMSNGGNTTTTGY